ncbi:potassium/sodium hyperpolarization-activated cyclic nucleotide-gated channel 2-like [Leptinotarsa decemlineata]|uniref:potassium/sodium hyperpolarization-activated cyclic nucleotide-gated channel 2-like n=1 Tax=Leptinotarsa decemlineata TaxID=7539 RepID=UPI003D30BE5F
MVSVDCQKCVRQVDKFIMKFKDVHECSFTNRGIDSLYPLPPNATIAARLLRVFRGLCLMDPLDVKTKEFFRNKSTMLAEQKRHANSPNRFVIHPFSKMNHYLEIIFFVSWLWQYFSIPIIHGFRHQHSLPIVIIKKLLNLFQLVVFLSFFFLGYVDTKKREIVIEPRKILFRYLTTYFFFDLIAVFYYDLIFLTLDEKKLLFDYYTLNYITSVMGTVAYFVRFKYFIEISRNIATHLGLPKSVYTLCYHFTVTALVLHIMACSLFSIPRLSYGETFPEGSWLWQANMHDIREVYFGALYCESMIMTVCYFFGATFDKYKILEPEEEVVLTIVSIFGRLYTLYLLADILKIFGLVGVSESKYEQYLGQLEEYMLSKNLPDELRLKLLKFYEYKLKKHYFNETQIFATLSENLKTELFLFGARRLIEKAQVLKSLPKPTLAALLAVMRSETFVQMDVITKAGSSIENIYFISAGTVAVINSENIEINHLEDGDEFGFFVTSEGKQLFTHVAIETSEIFYLSKKTLLEFLGTHPEIFKYFDARVRKLSEKYRNIESTIGRGGDDVLSSLRSGNILEKQNIREMDFEFTV